MITGTLKPMVNHQAFKRKESNTMNCLIVCVSRYGSTLCIGRWMAERLPWERTDVYSVEDAPDPGPYELVFLGGGVYNEQVDGSLLEYVTQHRAHLEGKRTVLFAVCLDTTPVYVNGRFHGGFYYTQPLLEAFKDDPPLHVGILSGEINPKKLSRKDYGLLMTFYNKILKRNVAEVPYRSLMNKTEVWDFVEKVLARIDGRL